eukprot:696441-Lingulodinium_polyedra.AAC.1
MASATQYQLPRTSASSAVSATVGPGALGDGTRQGAGPGARKDPAGGAAPGVHGALPVAADRGGQEVPSWHAPRPPARPLLGASVDRTEDAGARDAPAEGDDSAPCHRAPRPSANPGGGAS